MYFIELRYTNGTTYRLPTPYYMWQEAREALNQYIGHSQYSASIVQD